MARTNNPAPSQGSKGHSLLTHHVSELSSKNKQTTQIKDNNHSCKNADDCLEHQTPLPGIPPGTAPRRISTKGILSYNTIDQAFKLLLIGKETPQESRFTEGISIQTHLGNMVSSSILRNSEELRIIALLLGCIGRRAMVRVRVSWLRSSMMSLR